MNVARSDAIVFFGAFVSRHDLPEQTQTSLVEFVRATLACPGCAHATSAVKAAAAAIEPGTATRVTREIRRRPASRARSARERVLRGAVGGIDTRIDALPKSLLRINQEVRKRSVFFS